MPQPSQSAQPSHAVVIGGSMAGLLAARVASKHFDRVTLIDRDHFLDSPGERKGVPQARHLHILLLRGKLILDDLFPGLQDDLDKAGAPTIHYNQDIYFYFATGLGKRIDLGLTSHFSSRALLEWLVYQRVAHDPKIIILEGCDVTDLVSSVDRRRVLGVRYKSRETHTESDLAADLVIDASGRSSHAPDWLKAIGFGEPEVTTVDSFLGYASRAYRKPENYTGNWKGIVVQARPPDLARGGGIFEIENGQWICTLAGAAHDYPPVDDAGFLDFARSLAMPQVYDAIKGAEPLTPISGYQRTQNQYRHYEKFRRWPDQFVIMGDAVCAFNPVYGQGMTVAAIEAQALDQTLSRLAGRVGMARHFQQRLSAIASAAWILATSEDFRYPQTEGARPGKATALIQAYVNRVLLLSPHNSDVSRAILEMTHMLKPSTVIFQPHIMFQVLGSLFAARKPTHPITSATE